MRASIGQIVRSVKADLGGDLPDIASTMGRMAQIVGKAEYIRALTVRVKALREAKGWSQGQMALALGVTEEAYRKYETRSPLPIALVERLALISGRSVQFIVTGKEAEQGPLAVARRAGRRVRS